MVARHESPLVSTLKLVWSPEYEVDIGAHVFPTRKYRLVRDRLLAGGAVSEDAFVEPEPASDEALGRVHTDMYLRKIRDDDFSMSERWQLEVPFSRQLEEAMRLCCGGTVLAARLAGSDGVSVHLGGGFHHAFADHGEGFCLLNDVAVAAADLLASGGAARVSVIDLDVHHGNGTAAIFARDHRVFTFSMHEEANYPAVKPPSDLDIGLPHGIGDEDYLRRLTEALPAVLDDSGAEAVLYLAGADPYREDQLGGLGLTLDGLRRRDRTVLEACRARTLPVAVTLAGGYARNTDDTVRIHVATVEEALRVLE